MLRGVLIVDYPGATHEKRLTVEVTMDQEDRVGAKLGLDAVYKGAGIRKARSSVRLRASTELPECRSPQEIGSLEYRKYQNCLPPEFADVFPLRHAR